MRLLRLFLVVLLLPAMPAAWATLQTPTVAFSPAAIGPGATATLTITLDNSPPGNPSNIAFTSIYNANIVNAAVPNAATSCGGTATAAPLGSSLNLSGGSISGNNTCTVTVTVTSCNAGVHANPAFAVTSSSGNPTAPAATLTVTGSSPGDAALSSVSAAPASVPADGTASATVTVTLRSVCGTPVSDKTITLAQGAGSSVITPASAVTNASGVATFTVTSTTPETVTYTATDTTDGVAITQTAQVTFFPPPVVAKSFSPATINTGQTSSLSVTVTNLNAFAITGLAFTDAYPANLVNAAAPGLANTCAGAAGAAPGGTQLTLSGGTVAAGSSCTVSVNVTSAVAGSYNNGTGVVSSSNAGNGLPASAILTVNVAVASFNVVEPGGHPVTGRIFTKIAGQNIAVDIVARDAMNNVATAFTGVVEVELVDNTSGGACAGLPLIKALANQTFTVGDAGRHPLSAGQFEANAWRNVLFRVKYPAAAPPVTSCSSDAFANRPLQFVNVLARDLNRTTAGTTRTLNNTANPGAGNVHNAGRPFRIDTTAQNGAGTPATTTLYAPAAGQPVAILSQCGAGAVCPGALGTLTPGAWSAAAGVITTSTASYSDVGAFDLVLEDQTFAAVDAGDGTAPSERHISSAPVTVGRFVPDHFTLSGAALTPRSDIGACAGSSFTYMDEPMDLVFTLTAREAGGAVTLAYAGATLGALVLNSAASYDFGAIDGAGPTLLTGRLDLGMIGGITGAWAAGTTGAVTAPLAIQRAAAPDGPFAALRLGFAPADPDGVTLQASALDLDADNDATPERAQIGPDTTARFGQLRLQNAYGPANQALPIPLELQYWNGSGFATNLEDDCTTLDRANIALAFSGAIGACDTAVQQASLAFTDGAASLTLPAPGAAGTVVLTAQLAAAAGTYCPAVGAGTTPATSAAMAYLRGRWDGGAAYDDDPPGQAAFGLYGSQPKNFIFFRENY